MTAFRDIPSPSARGLRHRTPSDDGIPPSLRSLAEELVEVQRQGVECYTGIVNALIAENCRDLQQIEQTLDGLLGFACHPDGVQLYRRLCRHLWAMNPAAAAQYVQFYREAWDPDDERPWTKGEHVTHGGHTRGDPP